MSALATSTVNRTVHRDAPSPAGDIASMVSPPQLGIDELRGLMESVTETALRLQETHTALHGQVARLQQELAEANAALRRSQALAALGEMAAGIAHEVRNPLGSIQLYVQMLAEDLSDRPAQAELCGKIDRAVVGLDAIVRDVLSFARNMTIRPERITAEDLMDRAVAACDSLLGRDIQVIRETGASQPLQADGLLLGQALSNIIRNAVEAMNESGCPVKHLRLGTGRRKFRGPGGSQVWRVILSVQDSGPGIPEQVKDRIFNPFFTTRATGTGLGLAIVHRIVDAHGGQIHIQDVPSGGTRIELRLPVRPPVAADAPAATIHSEQGS